MTQQPTNYITNTVAPVAYQRVNVNGSESLRQRQRDIEENGRRDTALYQQAIAQKQQNDAIEAAKREQATLLAQQQAYSSNLSRQAQPGTTGTQRNDFSGMTGPRPSGATLGTDRGSMAVKAAEQYLGMPYQWGGSNPRTSFDCSGLVQYVYKNLGLNLPRVSNQQAMSGQRTAVQNLRPGDLVAWDNSSRNKGADHIAIYAGNGWIIEAAKKGTNVRYRRLGTAGMDSSAWGVRIN